MRASVMCAMRVCCSGRDFDAPDCQHIPGGAKGVLAGPGQDTLHLLEQFGPVPGAQKAAAEAQVRQVKSVGEENACSF